MPDGYTVREYLGEFKICGRLGPALLKGQSHGIERGAAKLQWA